MKKVLSLLLVSLLCFAMAFSFTACTDNSEDESASPTPTPTPLPADIDSSTVDVIGETWRVTELSFTSTKKYYAAKGEQAKVAFYGTFTHKDSGTSLTIPGFWDGDDVFKLRFAPTLYGVWEYTTKCDTDPDLNGKTGSIGANAYKGDLEIYKRGFVKSTIGTKYFTYADGTPFFYLGDTHWSLLTEEYDSAGDHAGNIKTDSHFKYIVDKRIEQGFTVYQSEPFPGDLTDGILQRVDLEAFQSADKYFKYIADKGLVHAHAQICFPTFSNKLAESKENQEALARYWVARFGAYPVMWTLSQEIDNDFYMENGNQSHIKYNDNFWVNIAEYINKYDAYNHPLTGHQENTDQTSIYGNCTNDKMNSNGGRSVFADEEVSNRTGHDWWGAQWATSFANPEKHWRIGEEYWASNKPAIMYESRYCYLWTKNFGARAQGWIAFLNGTFGYGYGAQDIWLYKGSGYTGDINSSDGRETVTTADKLMKWCDAIELESGYQVGYMRQFFEKFSWWKLVPDFDKNTYFLPGSSVNYACATEGNDVYVIYFYGKTKATGTLLQFDGNAKYTVKWFNPRTNEYIVVGENESANIADGNGNPAYQLPNKPSDISEDWVILVTKNKQFYFTQSPFTIANGDLIKKQRSAK